MLEYLSHLSHDSPFLIFLEKFDQAISDYTTGLKLKNDILPLHHRQIAEAYYKLGLVLDLTSGRLGDAIIHVQKAVESIDRRLELLRLRSEGDMPDAPPEDAKGKGKVPASALAKNDPIASLTVDQMKAEIKEFEGLKKELENKVCRKHFAIILLVIHTTPQQRLMILNLRLPDWIRVHPLWRLRNSRRSSGYLERLRWSPMHQ